MTAIDWKPDVKKLAEFSEAGLFAAGMVACPLAYLRGQPRLAAGLWMAAVAIRAVGMIRPRWLKPIYLGLSLATWPIGRAVSMVALGGLYLIVFTPIALFFRLIGRDVLRRSPDPSATTYWEPYRPDRGLERYFRPF